MRLRRPHPVLFVVLGLFTVGSLAQGSVGLACLWAGGAVWLLLG